ncbi:MAG: histidine utilization repressor [Rhizobiaceae bacterium MnEN-MB40S]|nr:MAG: histidine utilization repressor [Rhizobiaceae bacterium MnEN-MB40S]
MPTYKEIRSVLLDRIKSGEWKPGMLMPPEAELAGEYGTTRVTVNRAMQALAEDGFVERRRKAGTRVVQRMTRDAHVRIRIVRDEIEQSGRRYSYLLVSRGVERPPQAIQAELGLAAETDALHVLCLHFADSKPFQLENRWISLDVVPQAADESFETVSPNEWLLQTVPYSNAEHVFRAAAAGLEETEHLDLGPQEPVFIIERTTWLEGQTVTHVRLSHPADGFRIVTRD